MPPPSPVWAWNYAEKKRVFTNTKLQMRVRIEGAWHESAPLTLEVEGAVAKKK